MPHPSKTNSLALVLALMAATGTAQAEALRDTALELFKPLPSTVPAVANKPITPAKIDLGKALFFDPRMSASGVVSCNSCHNLATGGDGNLETSIGLGWQKGPRNAPTGLNAVFNKAQFWDGRAADLADVQKAGMQRFVDLGCVACHAGINLGGEGYYPFGLIEKPGADVLPVGDKGRFAVTETADDKYVFRAAPLRNVSVTALYFHSGKVWDLKVAVQIMAESQRGEEISDESAEQIVAFLDGLTGAVPSITYPILPAETAATPRPSGEVLPQ